MSLSSPRPRDEWGGRLLKARAVVVLPGDAALPAPTQPAAREGEDEKAQVTAAEVAALRAKAEAEGRQEGMRVGQREGYAEGLRQGVEEGRRIVEQALAEAAELRTAAQRHVGRLAAEIASHLIGSALSLEPELVESHVGEILVEAQPLGVLEVLVHPQDMKAARAAKERWLLEMAGDVDLAVLPDAEIAPGSCRVRTRAGDIEWLWPQRLSEIDQAMQEVAERFELDR